MDKTQLSPITHSDAQSPPHSLPGRDSVADADTSLIRKRPRLTPTSGSDEDHSKDSSESPIVIEIIDQAQSPEDTTAAVTIMDDDVVDGDDFVDPGSVAAFPWTSPLQGPEESAARFADFYRDTTQPIRLAEISELASWLRSHLANSTTSHSRRTYSRDRMFWYHVGNGCKGFLSSRSLSLSQARDSPEYTMLRGLLHDFAALSANLCVAEADQLELATSRRDSIKPSSPQKHSLHYLSYIEGFERYTGRGDLVLDNAEHSAFAITSYDMALTFVSQNESAKAFLRVFTLLVTKPDLVESSHGKLRLYLLFADRLLRILETRILPRADSSVPVESLRFVRDFRDVLVHMVELCAVYAVPEIIKRHPDFVPSDFHRNIAGDLAIVVQHLASSMRSYAPPGMAQIVQDVTQFTIKTKELVTTSDGTSSTLPRLPDPIMTLIAYRMETMTSYIVKSGIMAVRVTGLDMLSHFLAEMWESHTTSSSLQESFAMLDFCAKYIISKGIMDHLFGPSSHADLIRRSGSVIGFLVATKTLTKPVADLLWSACLCNQSADLGQASLPTLVEVIRLGGAFEILHFLSKYIDLEPSQLGKPLIFLFREMVTTLPHKTPEAAVLYEAARISTSLFQRLSTYWGDAEVQGFRPLISKILQALYHTSNGGEEYWHGILESCAAEVENCTQLASASVQIIRDMLASFTSKPNSSRHMRRTLTFQQTAAELYQYIDRLRKSQGHIGPWRLALTSRISLAFILLSHSDASLPLSAEQSFWEYAFGEKALDNTARDIAWHTLTVDMYTAPALSAFFERCVELFIPHLNAEHATLELVFAFERALHGKVRWESSDSILSTEILRFALTASNNAFALRCTQVTSKVLFDKLPLLDPETAKHQQTAVVEKCFDCIRNGAHSLRAITTLRCLLQQSIDRAQIEGSSMVDDCLMTSSVEDEKTSWRFSLLVHGTEDDMKPRQVLMREKDTLGDLHSAIGAAVGFDEFSVICNGQKIDLRTDPLMEIKLSAIAGKGALIIRKINTLDSIYESRTKRRGRTSFEQAILNHFDDLYSYLQKEDGPHEQAFYLLTELRVCNTSLSLIQPYSSEWTTLFAVHILSSELQDQISLGVADGSFILRGVQTLVNLLEEHKQSENLLLLQILSQTLLKFVRERPIIDLVEKYFDKPQCLVSSVISTLAHAAALGRRKSTASSQISKTAENFYSLLLECTRLDNAVRQAFIEAPQALELHKTLLFHHDLTFARGIADCMRNFCLDDDTSLEMKSFFWTIFMESLSDAQDQPNFCASFYKVAPELLRRNKAVFFNEAELKSLVALFSTAMLATDHQERFEHDTTDHRISGLCSLLTCCVEQLKSLKKPLNMGDLAVTLSRKLIFPTTANHTSSTCSTKPIITSEARACLYRLLYVLCEDLQTLTELAEITRAEMDAADIPHGFEYPGRSSFNRSECGYSGLWNLQQTCYMNSLVQQLYMNIHFRKFIMDTTVNDARSQQVLNEFKRTFAYMQDSYELSYCPDDLARALDVDPTIQDDAQIFFTVLIGKLEDSMPDEQARAQLRSFFGGLNKSQTMGACGHVSESPDQYYNLSLVVKDKSTLEESLHDYVQGAPLEGGDKFKCITCATEGVYVNAVRRTRLDHIPDNLVLGLKRFRYETYDGGAKVNDCFDFPERLDMNPYKMPLADNTPQPPEPDMFQLVGVVVHDGTLQYGHYWSYAAERLCRDSAALPWLRLEDKFASQTTIENVISETRGGFGKPDGNGQVWPRSDSAYVLFYERVSSIEAAKGLVSNNALASTFSPTLCPRIPIPEDLGSAIADENQKHVRKLNLYASEHAGFVRYLLMRFEDLTKGQPTEHGEAERVLFAMAFEHLYRITTRTSTLEHLDQIVLSLQRIGSMHAKASTRLFELLFGKSDQDDALMHFIFHRKQTVRAHIRRLIVSCLRGVQEMDSLMYGANTEGELPGKVTGCIQRATSAHADLRHYLYSKRECWAEYFEFATDVAALGLHETTLILERGYLQWCLEVIMIYEEPALQRKHSDMWFHMQQNRIYKRHLLTEVVHNLLCRHVDLSNLGQSPRQQHQSENDDKTSLNGYEARFIEWREPSGDNMLMRTVLSMVGYNQGSTGPGLLAALFTDPSRVPKSFKDSVLSALTAGLSEPEVVLAHVDAIATCVVQGRLGRMDRAALIGAVTKLPQQFEDVAETVLQFMKIVYTVEPSLVIHFTPAWIDKLLACEDSDSEEAALQWLDQHITQQVLPVRASTDDDVEAKLVYDRTVTVKTLAARLMHNLHVSYQQYGDGGEYETTIAALERCRKWLAQLVHNAQVQLDMEQPNDGTSVSQVRNSSEQRDDEKGTAARLGGMESFEDWQQVVVDAGEILEQCEQTLKDFQAWLQVRSPGLALRHRRNKGARSGISSDGDEYNDAEADDDDVETGDEDWLSDRDDDAGELSMPET